MEKNDIILKQFMAEQLVANEPWPDDVILYQPYEAEQILLAENASCLAVKSFLNMCKVPYTIKCSANAEFMSPGGRMTKLPFIKVGQFVIAEFEPIVNFLEQKEFSLSKEMDEDDRSDMRAYMSLVENIFTNAELYISFVDEQVYQTVTCSRNGCVYPWPLMHIQNYKKRRQVLKQLHVYQWKEMSIREVIEKVEKCCETLTTKLEQSGKYFYGNEPTELDAMVFGHFFTILTTKLPNNILAETIKTFDKLVKFVENIDFQYFRTRL